MLEIPDIAGRDGGAVGKSDCSDLRVELSHGSTDRSSTSDDGRIVLGSVCVKWQHALSEVIDQDILCQRLEFLSSPPLRQRSKAEQYLRLRNCRREDIACGVQREPRE